MAVIDDTESNNEHEKISSSKVLSHWLPGPYRTYEVTNRIHRAILHIRDMSALYSEICRIIVEVGQFRMVWIGVPKLNESPAVTLVGSAGVTDSYLSHLISPTSDEHAPEGEGPFMRAVRTGKPQITLDIALDPLMASWREEGLRLGVRSAAAFPVVLHGQVACVFSLYHPQSGYFTGEELGLFEEIVDSLAFALDVQAMDEGRKQAETQLRLTAKAFESAEDEIRRLADQDMLTGLANRRAFYQVLDSSLQKRKFMQGNSFVFLIDIDRFHEVNDSLGHVMGDLLLQEVARRLIEGSQTEDLVARLGGDEFVILGRRTNTSKTLVQEAKRFAEYLLAKLSLPYSIGQHVIYVTASIGIRTFFKGRLFPEDMVHDADLAMNQAKRLGGNAVVGYDPTLKQKSQFLFSLEQDLRTAVDQKEIEIFFQGQYDFQGRLVGAEALSRWKRSGEWISPSEFIPLAEQTGLMNKLGSQILRQALGQLRQWNQGIIRLPKLSINLSAVQLQSSGFVKEIKQLIWESHVSPRWVMLEITESALIKDLERVKQKLEALRAFGVQFSLDDFGTGYSSLTMLHSLPIQELKIDRKFTRELFSNLKAYEIAKSIVAIGQSLTLRIIAEGVENQDEREVLFQLGCREYQGYLFMRPESGLDFAKRLSCAENKL